MQLDVKNALDKFGKSVVKQSRTQLAKQKKNASKTLSKSIGYDLKVSKNSFEMTFSMEKHGAYINDGVVGTEKNKTSSGGLKLGSQKFKYKKGIENKPSWKHFDKWLYSKGIAPRSKQSGKFVTRRGVAEAISYSVWRGGQKTTNFFTRPFEVAFKQLPDQLVEAYGLEVDTLIEKLVI
jgi:hypothetical protein